MILLLAFLLIAAEAVSEGLQTAGHLLSSEITEAVSIFGITWFFARAITTRIPEKIQRSTWNFTKLLIAYFLLRFAIFDSAWNLAAGQEWDFYGTTKIYDQIMTQLGSFGWMLKGIAGIWAIAWLTNYRHQAEAR